MRVKSGISMIIALQMCISCLISVHASGFEDINKGDKIYNSVMLLKDLGIVEGVGDNRFNPTGGVTRGDFAVMMDKALALEDGKTQLYDDVSRDRYYAGSVARVSAAGIIRGDGDGRFNPDAPINKNEAAVILVKAYENHIGQPVFAPGFAREYLDYAKIDAWARPFIDKGVMLGLIEPQNSGLIEGKRDFSRGETAYSIAKLILLMSERKEGDPGMENFIKQWKRGNIFLDNEIPGFTIKTGNGVIEYVVTDYWNKICQKNTVRVSNGSVDLTFPELGAGYYRVGIFGADSKGVKSEILKTTMCVLTDFDFRSVKNSPFGMNTHLDRLGTGWSYDLLQEAYYIGIKHIRENFEWPGIEGSKGDYTRMKSVLDNYYSLLKKYDMTPLEVTGFSHAQYDNGATPYTEEGRKGYANYSKSFFDLYSSVTTQEMFNEFWGPQFGDRGNGPADSLPAYYVPLLKTVYTTIKAAHPNALLMLCVMPKRDTGIYGSYGRWTEETFAHGGLEYTDGVIFHQYAPRPNMNISLEDSLRSAIADLKAMIDEHNPTGKDFPIWLTETGSNSSTNQYGNTEENQARFVPRIAALELSEGVERVYFYDLIDDGNTDSEHEDRFGSLHAFGSKYGNYTPKPAYVSYGAMTRALANQQYVKNESFENGIEWYRFDGGGRTTHLLCTRGLPSAEQPLDVVIYANGKVTITDVMGGKKEYMPVDGKLYLTLNGDTLYLDGNITGVEERKTIDFEIDEWISVGSTYGITAISEDTEETEGMTFMVDGGEYVIGERMTIAPFYTQGSRTVVVEITKNGQLCGRMLVDAKAQKAYTAKLGSGVEYQEETEQFRAYLNVEVQNNSLNELLANSVVLNIDGNSIEKNLDRRIGARDTQTMRIDLGETQIGTKSNISARLCMDNVLSDEIDALASFQYNAAYRYSVNIDGVLDEGLNQIQYQDIVQEGEILALASDGSKYGGDADLSGKLWITYDEKNLYVTVDVIDDRHEYPNAGENIWRNDCVQLGIFSHETDAYAKESLHYDFGISDSGKDAAQVWAWTVLNESESSSEIPGLRAKVTRNESTKHTLYEIALAWNETLKIDIANLTRIDLCVAVNDCDLGVRQTAIEIGSGIVFGKDPGKYKQYSILK